MALLINTQIGTDRGITSEGYVRIESFNYNAHNGVMVVSPKLYLDVVAAESASAVLNDTYYTPTMYSGQFVANNLNVKNEYTFYVTSSFEAETYFERPGIVSSSVEITTPDPANPGEMITSSQWVFENVTLSGSEAYTKSVVDNSALVSSSIYDFAYPLLKYELEVAFGEGTIEDLI